MLASAAAPPGIFKIPKRLALGGSFCPLISGKVQHFLWLPPMGLVRFFYVDS
jgi:hypothetical protein